nr:unnamed protein product [Digitaria exilis]
MTNSTTAFIPLEDPRAEMSVTIEPSQARGGRSPSSGRFRLDRGSASSSLRARLELATPGTTPGALRPINSGHDDAPLQSKRRGFTTPRHRPRPGEDTGQIHSQQWTSERNATQVGPGSDTMPTTPLTLLASDALPSPSKETTEVRSGRRAQVATLEAVRCHERSITSTAAMPSAGVGRRDSRSHSARRGQHSAPRNISTTNTCTHALPLGL